ncbi:hypothetical protein [Bradyrhizobium ottawaense]|uniref:hypothetical protein n=1 Tax=Bradyrhizobium ottawaense TaxID=931866 RepID=UPI0038515873
MGRGQFVTHVEALPGHPYDGHTLATMIPDVVGLVGNTIARILADKGYVAGVCHGPTRALWVSAPARPQLHSLPVKPSTHNALKSLGYRNQALKIELLELDKAPAATTRLLISHGCRACTNGDVRPTEVQAL